MNQAQQLGDQGAKQVADHNKRWMEQAKVVTMCLVSGHLVVTADDLRNQMPTPPHPNCTGAVFKHLAREHKIVCVGTTTSTHPSTHGRLIRKWGRV